jgi:DNA-binding transcriptional regulator YdaS (Cro superfamily)
MQSKPESFQTRQLLLAKEQSHFEQWPRGTVIRVAAGSVALVQRTNLERCMLAQQTTMQRGAVHCVEVSTWVEIVAQADADVVVMVPRAVSLVQELRAGLDAVWGRLGVRRKERRVGERCASRPAL